MKGKLKWLCKSTKSKAKSYVTVTNGDIFKVIDIKFLLIASVTEAEDVVEVHTVAEDMELDCYSPTLVFIITLMESYQVNGYYWIPVQPQVYAITKK